MARFRSLLDGRTTPHKDSSASVKVPARPTGRVVPNARTGLAQRQPRLRQTASAPSATDPRSAPPSPHNRPMRGPKRDQIVVGISDYAVQRGSGFLVTHALGSCVGVVALDRSRGIAGLLHILLPSSKGDTTNATKKPGMYADTGLIALLRALHEAGADRTKLRFLIAGGASMLNCSEFLNVGKKNVLAIRKALWSAGVLVENEHVGGTMSRTLRVDIAQGRVTLRSPNQPELRL